MKVLVVAGGAAVAAVAWAVAPWRHMRRHGTLDEQTVRGWRAEAAALDAARAAGESAEPPDRPESPTSPEPAAPPETAIPRPRTRSGRRSREAGRAITRPEEDPAVSPSGR